MCNLNVSERINYQADSISLAAAEKTELSFAYPTLVFVMESVVELSMHFTTEVREIQPGHLFLLPSGITCFASSQQCSRIICMEIPDINFIFTYYVSRSPHIEAVDMGQLLCPLKVREPMNALLKTVSLYIEDNMSSSFLMELKIFELFYIFKACYPVEDLYRLFGPILSDDYRFALFVLSRHHQVSTSKDLCNLSGYTPAHFGRKFRKIFGESPYKWMLQKKIQNVYTEVKETTKPLKVIADQYGFNSCANFGDFCRKHFGLAPSALRER